MDITLQTQLKSIEQARSLHKPVQNETGFSTLLSQAIGETNRALQEADKKTEALQKGEDVPLHDVMISMEQADISMRLFVQMRNQVVEAYKEIMRLQI